MPQITFLLAAKSTTLDIVKDATTSGPIRIPAWAPDIAAISTTTVEDHQALILGTTADKMPLSVDQNYTARCFGMKVGRTIHAGKEITLDYRAVGELVRT